MLLGLAFSGDISSPANLENTEPGIEEGGLPFPAKAAEVSGSGDQRQFVERRVRFQVVDALTSEPLELTSLSLVSDGPEGAMPVFAKSEGLGKYSIGRFAWEGRKLHWEFSVPSTWGETIMAVPHPSCVVGENKIALPYSASITGYVLSQFHGSPLSGASIRVFSLDRQLVQQLRDEMENERAGASIELDSLPFLLYHYERKYGEPQVVSTVSGDGGFFSLNIQTSGLLVLAGNKPDYSSSTMGIEVQPGEVAEYSLSLPGRTVVEGYVVRQSGEAVPRANVQIGAIYPHYVETLGTQEAERGASIAQLNRGPGDFPIKRYHFSVTADENGFFSHTVPATFEFGVLASIGDAHGVQTRRSAVFEERVRMDIEISSNSEKGGRVLFLVGEDGAPLIGATVLPRVRGEYPWFWQYPEIQTDREGRLFLPKWPSSASVALYVSHPAIPSELRVLVSPGQEQVMCSK